MNRPAVRHSRERFPTTELAVPNLARLVWRLREAPGGGSVTIVHAVREGEGEWALAIAAARIARGGVKVVGPEPSTVPHLVEYGLHVGAKVIFGGELRRADDGRALRTASAMGVKAVGIITAARFADAQLLAKALGPWSSHDFAFFSVTCEAPNVA